MSVKAFDLVSISNQIAVNDAGPADITSLDYCAGCIYVGTLNGYIIRFTYDEKARSGLQSSAYKVLKTKKDVTKLQAILPFTTLFALSDGALHTIHMVTMEIQSTKPRGVSAFCVNSAVLAANGATGNGVVPPNVAILCCARGKHIVLFGVIAASSQGDACKLNQLREFNLEDEPVAVAMDNATVCYASSSGQYFLLHCDEIGDLQPLLPFDTVPLVRSIRVNEFLINGPSGLGIFVSATSGGSERAPLNWGSEVTWATYAHPYVLCLTHDAVLVYSIFDSSSEPKQRIAFRGGTCLESFDGGRTLIIGSRDRLFALVPVPWEIQVQRLLQERKVTEALELAQHSNKTNLTSDEQQRILQRIQQEAGFVHFQQLNFEQARALFIEGGLNVYELLDLFPEFRPPSFQRQQLHEIVNVTSMCDNDSEKIRHCQQFLMEYLESQRPYLTQTDPVWDGALLQLYAIFQPDELLKFVTLENFACDATTAAQLLVERRRPHAAALLLYTQGRNRDAFEIWTGLLGPTAAGVWAEPEAESGRGLGEIKDEQFLGVEFVANILMCLNKEMDLLRDFAPAILSRDQKLGVKIFLERCKGDASQWIDDCDELLQILEPFENATVEFLEHVTKLSNRESLHTRLASVYMRAVDKCGGEGSPIAAGDAESASSARARLRRFLEWSNHYRIRTVLQWATERNLHRERVVMYRKLGNHSESLEILVRTLRDFDGAEAYCDAVAGNDDLDATQKRKLYASLLALYLDPNLSEPERNDLIPPAIQLLNSPVAVFDSIEVLNLLPSDWSVGMVDQFLARTLRTTLHRSQMLQIRHALTRFENMHAVHLDFETGCRRPLLLKEGRLCPICQRPFLNATFVWLPNGQTVHLHCQSKLNNGSPTHSSRS